MTKIEADAVSQPFTVSALSGKVKEHSMKNLYSFYWFLFDETMLTI